MIGACIGIWAHWHNSHCTVMTVLWLSVVAENEREKFAVDNFTLPEGTPRCVSRSNLYDDVVKVFMDEHIIIEYPLRIKFEEERAMDCGGVSRDMLSGFWEEAYQKLFDGCQLMTPVIHPQVDMKVLPIIGRILSHGYIASGFLPVRIAFPTLACLLLGPTVSISDGILLDTFPDCLSAHEAKVIREAFNWLLGQSYKVSLWTCFHDLVAVKYQILSI